MYIVRDIFQLRFGAFKDAKALLDEAYSKGLLPDAKSARVLSDFTGDSYRLIFEEGYDSLADYEKSLTGSMKKADWKKWYEKFKQHIESSQREIVKLLM
ncbi:hypothetical protein CAP36_09445 [Chitinophagaceae bacterium IBVUCB2]|nr:hypothetical protein CAP36_09445 [Chitinophagaceae bacterium IBVUCB2]